MQDDVPVLLKRSPDIFEYIGSMPVNLIFDERNDIVAKCAGSDCNTFWGVATDNIKMHDDPLNIYQKLS
jgi:hypothetical protein